LTSDYARGTGDPSPYLKRIAEGGFTHVHWCHQWNTDFLYSRWEIARIGEWLAEYGLKLLDLHGSVGPEKNWASPREYERLAGMELVANRVEMAARLGGEVVIMHAPGEPGCAPFLRSLAELEGLCRGCGVRIALENGDFRVIREALSRFAPGFLGLCYDCGHGNMIPDGLDALDSLRDRLISVHLHDNDGTADQHNLPFTATVDWPRLARIMAGSSYRKCVSMESAMRCAGIADEGEFVARARDAGAKLSRMVEKCRAGARDADGACRPPRGKDRR